MVMDGTGLGAPLQAVTLFLVLSVLYDRYVTPLPASHPTVETWWWVVYVLAAPLVFGGVSPVAVHPLLTLFATRFAVEVLTLAQGHWTVAMGVRACPRPAATPIRLGLPLLPD